MNTLQIKFEQFDKANPEIWRLFFKFTLIVMEGRKRIGGKAVMERVRWESIVDSSAKSFKVNNSYTAYYVRKFQAVYPQFAHVFETRKVKV